MSISVSKIVNLAPAAVKFLVQDEIEDEPVRVYKTIGGVFSDTDYAWLSNGPRLEVIHNKTGCKVGAWTFGWVLKDSNTEVMCVEEIQRPHGRLPLLAVGVDCDFSGGMLCIFDFITSKVIRAIQIRDKITTLHVVDAGYDVFTLPGPLRNFDGIIAVGTAGGDVFLIDICRQICDEALTIGGLSEIRDELNPCLLNNITSNDISKIEFHKEFAIRNSQHLAIHLNVVLEQSTRHFTLKGPKGDDRIHVNKDEVTVSALYYCPQLGSLLIGYNFGALQLYNLMNLHLVYTSPVCDEHIPITHFAIQEPADDPRAFCYVWAVYSASEKYPTCLPLAVMYAFCYHTKEYHEGYGFLYQDFNTAAVHYQMELGVPQDSKRTAKPLGGYCLKLNSINQGSVNKGPHHDSNEDSLTLCALVWNVCFNKKEIDTFVCLFDLNQWYKEQMPPSAPNTQYSSTFMIQLPISNLVNSSTNKSVAVVDVHIDKMSVRQFTGAQRLEEHFCPNSISFGMCCLRVSDLIHLQNIGIQKALLAQIESSGPLCLVEPAEMYQEIIGIGLIPLFIDLPVNTPITTNQQREIILGTGLENQLMGWLCKCASEWANGSYLSTGCSLDLLITWAFQRAVALKTNCDNFCVPLFDHSQTRLDNNTHSLLNSCTRQLMNLCALYAFIIKKLFMFVSNQDLVTEQYKSLEMVSVYFEVLQWLLNVGLLPECPLSAYPRSDDMERINAPYPAEMLSDFYNHRRGLFKILNEENFSSSDSVLFIDTLIERQCGGSILQEQWRNDGGNGLYPPPSLQSLLRTYLIDSVELSYKHSVVIYVFLDLAMTLDQARYKPVITYLIKFPAVFKVSPSLIKITQAFWQLDHGDYNTAMGLLLDPLISNNDLKQWHHKVALRSLLLQKQYNFALLYVEIRKPTFKDDEDVMLAISLYVANNLLDEAFHFEKYFISQFNGEKFLLHLFKECTKNDKIRSIIYRSLNTTEENCFLKYLMESKHPDAEDLHVYYHILRSHYIEAFESHDRSVPNQIENQGLMGQESAIPRDKLVYSLKKLLPDVTRSLLSLCQKEKHRIWQQVSKPAPMSVSVHNIDKNVQYKSSSVGIALSKAKQTFNETLIDKFKVETERTPFLRTPRTSIISKRTSSVVITPKVLDNDEIVDDISSHTPAKRLKLSPRVTSGSLSTPIPSKLDTPLVKRKTYIARSSPDQQLKVTTPHGILKVKSDGTNEFEDDFKTFEKLEYTPISSKKSGLGLSPRKSLAKPSPVVRFEGLKSSSSSSLNASRSLSEKLAELSSTKVSPNNRLSGSSKNTSTEEEIFYSPDNSLEIATEANEKVENENKETENVSEVEEIQEDHKDEVEGTKVNVQEETPVPVFSPKGRRSYKRAFGSTTPVRSSPRLSKTHAVDKEMTVSPVQKVPEEVSSKTTFVDDLAEESTSSTDKTTESTSSLNESVKGSTLPKLRPRRSLCRKVLETNALNRVLSSPVASPRSRRKIEIPSRDEDVSKNEVSLELTPLLTSRRSLFRKKGQSLQSEEVTNSKESTETILLESTIKYADGEESKRSSFMKRHNLTTSFVESDLDTSEEFIISANVPVIPGLSSSMLSYINSNNKSVASDTSSLKDVDAEKSDDSEKNKSFTKTVRVTEAADKTLQYSTVTDDDLMQRENEKNEEKAAHDKNIDEYRTTTSERDQSAYSVYDSSCSDYFNMSYKQSGPKFSESMMRCIYDRNVSDEETDRIPNNDKETMDVVDNEDIIKDEQRIEHEESPNSTNNKMENEESQKKESHEKSAEDEENAKEEVSDGGSSNRTVDPEMNVFEISDDLSINNGLVVQKEVTFEENDLCYEQQNTLENVLEENITSALEENISVTSTTLKVHEMNVFSESFEEPESSEAESDVNEEQEANKSLEEPVKSEDESDIEEKQEGNDKEVKDTKQLEETKPIEVIEIGSSSDENEEDREESSEYDSERSFERNGSDEEKLEVSYERNIYDTEDDYSSESNYESRYSEHSENSDESKCNESELCGLFHGDIILVSCQKENESNEDEEEEEEEEQTNNKSKESNEEDGSEEDEEISEADTLEDQKIDKDSEVKIVDDDNSIKINETTSECESSRDKVKDKMMVVEDAERRDEKLPSVEHLEELKEQEGHNAVTIAESVERKKEEELSSANQSEKSKNQDNVTIADSVEQREDENLQSIEQLEESKHQDEHEVEVTNEEDGDLQSVGPLEDQEEYGPVTPSENIKEQAENKDQEHGTVATVGSTEEKKDENKKSVKQLEESKDQREYGTIAAVGDPEEKGDENTKSVEQSEDSKDQGEYDAGISEEEKKDKIVHKQENGKIEKDAKYDKNMEQDGVVKPSGDREGIKEDHTVEEHRHPDVVKNDTKGRPTSRDKPDITIVPPPQEVDIKEEDKVEEHPKHDESNNDTDTNRTSPQEGDIIDSYEATQKNEGSSTDVSKPRTRSASVSEKPAKRTRQKSTDVGEEPTRRSTRRTKEIGGTKLDTEPKDATTSKSEFLDSSVSEPVRVLRSRRVSAEDRGRKDSSTSKSDILDLSESESARVLRSRRVSVEEAAKPTLTLRKRSASVDETKVISKQPINKEKVESEKNRTKRAASVSHLPQIVEENDDVKHVERKRSRSVLENYSEARRVTRQQLHTLKQVGGESVSNKIKMDYLDPIVFLDRIPIGGKLESEEKQVHESSPPSSGSAPFTRSRTRSASVSSVHSDDSNASETAKVGKRRTRLTAQGALAGIQEEPSNEKSVVPKKRTRKNSSQK